jgi:hypothetical protein
MTDDQNPTGRPLGKDDDEDDGGIQEPIIPLIRGILHEIELGGQVTIRLERTGRLPIRDVEKLSRQLGEMGIHLEQEPGQIRLSPE